MPISFKSIENSHNTRCKPSNMNTIHVILCYNLYIFMSCWCTILVYDLFLVIALLAYTSLVVHSSVGVS